MKKHKKIFLALLIASTIAFNSLAPFFANYNISAGKLASIFGDKILICTGSGFAFVKLEDVLSKKSPIKPHKNYFCPLCYISASDIGKILVVAALAFFITRGAGLLSNFFLISAKPRRFAFAAAYVRAPPR